MRCRIRALAAALITLCLATGCGDVGTNPDLQGPALGPAVVARDLEKAETWKVVCSKTVSPGTSTKMEGSRYTLRFSPLSLIDELEVTIMERDQDIVDVELGPDGSVFYKPVILEIDYRDTRFDPSHPDYRGPGMLFWFNPEIQGWVPVSGTTDDPRTCTYTARLQHFSRYAMGDGTSGWEDALGDREKDSIQ